MQVMTTQGIDTLVYRIQDLLMYHIQTKSMSIDTKGRDGGGGGGDNVNIIPHGHLKNNNFF